MTDLIINAKDARGFGVSMGDGFIEALLLPAGNKEYIENESRLEDGKQVIFDNPKLSSRNVSLTFNVEGENSEEYLVNYETLVTELQKGRVIVSLPALRKEFNLKYQNATSFALNSSRTFSRLTCKFEEPNPKDR